ncbi:MAG TPA: hypothetical protein VMR51_03680 [Patescibacteria group bacterium]|nr:hypothetical protein [Patescibacteria group bacterium]
MTSVIILGGIVGLLAGMGLPYFVVGAKGYGAKIFGMPSSAAVNVVWGWLSFVAAGLLWHVAPMKVHPRAAFAAVAVGVLIAGLVLSMIWPKHDHKK